MATHWNVVIIGGGIAGLSAARMLREESAELTIVVIDAEDRLPYKRTKVSKFIAKGFERNQFQLQTDEWYREQQIDLRVHQRVVEVEADAHCLRLENGEELSWDKLLLATGAGAVLPEEFRLEDGKAHVVRGAEDVERVIRSAEQGVKNALVVGTGVLGIEVAEQLRLLNKEVAMVGVAPALMPRHLNVYAAEVLKACCEEAGISLHLEERVTGVAKNSSGALDIILTQQTLQSDLLLFCIGARPDVALAQQAGLEVDRGIRVNEYLQSSHPDIFAAGDVAEHPGGAVSGLWHAAELQGQVAAKNILGLATPYDQRPFRLKCEVFGRYFFSMNKPEAGALSDYQLVERRQEECYQAFYFQQERLRAVVMIDDKARAKLYERAVWEGWEHERVDEAFGMSHR